MDPEIFYGPIIKAFNKAINDSKAAEKQAYAWGSIYFSIEAREVLTLLCRHGETERPAALLFETGDSSSPLF